MEFPLQCLPRLRVENEIIVTETGTTVAFSIAVVVSKLSAQSEGARLIIVVGSRPSKSDAGGLGVYGY